MPDTHYELFQKLSTKSPWTLVDVYPDRTRAINEAHLLAKRLPKGGVRVIKETFKAKTGTFDGVQIFAAGNEDVLSDAKDKKKKASESAIVCFRPDDLYTVHARATIGRILQPFLNRHKVTVCEMLHRADLLEQLDSSGTDLQHAIQKYAITQKSEEQPSVHPIIRQLTDLTQKSMARVFRDEKQNRFADISEQNLVKSVRKISKGPEPLYRFSGSIAKYLSDKKDWPDKIQALTCLAEILSTEEDAGKVGFAAIDMFLSEIISTHASIKDFVGPTDNLGDALFNLTNLFLGRTKDLNFDPNHPIARFAKICSAGHLPSAKRTLGQRILKEVRSSEPLYADCIQTEGQMARKIANLIVVGQGPDLPITNIKDAFCERSRRLVNASALDKYMATLGPPDERVEKLLAFAENIVGDDNKKTLGDYTHSLIMSHAFEIFSYDGGTDILERLRRIAQLQSLTREADLGPRCQTQLAQSLDSISCRVIQHSEFFDMILRRAGTPIDQALLLLHMSLTDVFTEGDCSGQVKTMLAKILPQVDRSKVRPRESDEEGLQKHAEKKEKLHSMLTDFQARTSVKTEKQAVM